MAWSSSLGALMETLAAGLAARGLPGSDNEGFVGHEPSTWRPVHFLVFVGIVVTLSELLDRLCFWVCERVLRLPLIPTTGKHLDELTAKDHLYVAFNRFVFSSGWMLFCLRWEHLARPDQVVWGGLRELTLANTVVAAALFFTCHDLLWAPLHCLFHSHPALYRAFHKFHHKQLAPSRGLGDAFFNTPLEALIGLAIHSWAIWVVPAHLCPMHVFTLRLLVPLSQIQAFAQHCRFDLRSPIGDAFLDSWKHDLHHWQPTCNFGSYTNVVDRVMGTHRRPNYGVGGGTRGKGEGAGAVS